MVEIDDIKDFSDDRARFGPIHHTVFNEKNKQRPADKNPNDIPEIQTGTGFPPVDPDARKQEIEEMAALIAGPEGLDVGLFESSGGSFYIKRMRPVETWTIHIKGDINQIDNPESSK